MHEQISILLPRSQAFTPYAGSRTMPAIALPRIGNIPIVLRHPANALEEYSTQTPET